ncbi:MAG: F0F1 ATP synthase subunit gamma [Leptolyngbya sp. DLM2.Bin27]|nr:MAG: F0F1 ATP synthase subunit gamma [Leptolyngbya sp. DLM2.Bin27]
MLTLEALQTQIHSIEDLQAVVRTMKALALVSIRQYEQARISLTDYNTTVELGLQALLHHRRCSEDSTGLLPGADAAQTPGQQQKSVGVIVFGSDHGLCGQFNEQVADYALEQMHRRAIPPDCCRLAAVGARLIPYLEAANQPIQQQFALPSALTGTPRLIQDLLRAIEQWRFPQTTHQQPRVDEPAPMPHPDVDQILLFYHQSLGATAFQPVTLQLLPLDLTWLQQLEQRPWQSAALPMVSTPWQPLFSALIRQYLFVSLYRATVESLASEHAARLASMQAAEKNIEERLTDLNGNYRQQRQNAITGELLDIVSGFEALKQPRRYKAAR